MKILALNASPRKEGQSKTELMLSNLVKGMRAAGAEVETVHLRDNKIRLCVGCFTCWTKTPGVCVHKDDMTKELYPKWLASDLAVYATPLYHFHLNAQMKAFIERTLPILEPFFVEGQERTRHPLRARHPKIVLLSVAGFPEMQIFDQLSAWARYIFGRGGALVAEIYRPAAQALVSPHLAAKAEEVLAATARGGGEIVRDMQIAPETMERIQQDLFEGKRLMHRMGNLFWKTCIAEGVTPKEFGERGLLPRPDSMETFMLMLRIGFNARAAADTRAVMQFDFSGEAKGSCHFTIKDGTIAAKEGPAERADVVIQTPFELWMDIITGKADGQQMFMAQKYTASGDLNLLIRMGDFFGR